MIGPNAPKYVADYHTCPDCGVTHRDSDLEAGACKDKARCMKWQVERKVQKALASIAPSEGQP